MKRILLQGLLLIGAFLCVGCGAMQTNYYFPKPNSAHQKEQIAQAVDMTAHLMNMEPLTEQVKFMQSLGDKYGRYYLSGFSTGLLQVSLRMDTRGGIVTVDIVNGYNFKSSFHKKIEKKLTPALRLIDPDVKINSGFSVSTLM